LKKALFLLCAFSVVFLCGGVAGAVNLYVDSAPNIYGSPDYASWWASAKSAASTGAFTNMANSSDPSNSGTTNFEVEDAVVYSFGDLGSRLHFIYWIDGATISSLSGIFKISLSYEWDGIVYDFYKGYYGSTWLEPTSWVEYNGGVIGTAGFAWWGAYGVNTQEALDADLAEWDKHQGDITFTVDYNGETSSLTANHSPVPEPSTWFLLCSGLAGFAAFRLKRRARV
jgi:hypothetical protein